MEAGNKGVDMLSLVRDLTHKRDKIRQSMMNLVQADKSLYLCYQQITESTAEYQRNFKAKVEVIEAGDGNPDFSRPATDLVFGEDNLIRADLGTCTRRWRQCRRWLRRGTLQRSRSLD